jgi:ferredoxin
MDTVVCNTCHTYINNSYIYFHNPLEVRQSTVTAERTDKSIVSVNKTSNTNNHIPGDDKTFVIEVKNFGPNPI